MNHHVRIDDADIRCAVRGRVRVAVYDRGRRATFRHGHENAAGRQVDFCYRCLDFRHEGAAWPPRHRPLGQDRDVLHNLAAGIIGAVINARL